MGFRSIRGYFQQYLTRRTLVKTTGSRIHQSAYIAPDTVIGKNCIISKNCIIRKGVKLGDNVKIGQNADLHNITIGDNSFIEKGVVVTGTSKGNISIGTQSYIGINNILDTSANINIGDYVHIAGPSTGLWTHTSAKMCLNKIPLTNLDSINRPTADIHIDSNTYIGGNCTVYPGIRITKKSIVAPNSAIVRNIELPGLYGGVPAKFIKKHE